MQAVDADPLLRRRWLNLEMVVAEAIRLPRITPSPRFLSELKAKIAPPSPSWWERMWAAVTARERWSGTLPAPSSPPVSRSRQWWGC
ncbi:MAG: hypothetical protein U0236_21700 [Nitrospira sp.]